MRLTLQKDMDGLRARAKQELAGETHRTLVHARKKLEAATVAAGGASSLIEAEAKIRGITPAALAAIILAKPDTMMEVELARQAAHVEIDAARGPAEIEAAVSRAMASRAE